MRFPPSIVQDPVRAADIAQYVKDRAPHRVYFAEIEDKCDGAKLHALPGVCDLLEREHNVRVDHEDCCAYFSPVRVRVCVRACLGVVSFLFWMRKCRVELWFLSRNFSLLFLFDSF